MPSLHAELTTFSKDGEVSKGTVTRSDAEATAPSAGGEGRLSNQLGLGVPLIYQGFLGDTLRSRGVPRGCLLRPRRGGWLMVVMSVMPRGFTASYASW